MGKFYAFMMIIGAAAICVAACMSCAGLGQRVYEGSPESMQAASAVKVVSRCGSGSGVITGPHSVMTALHVLNACSLLAESDEVKVIDSRGRSFKAHIVVSADDYDIAKLGVVGTLDYQGVRIGPPSIGGVCVQSASPVIMRACGSVDSLRYGGAGAGDIHHTVVVIPGNSGSGAYDEYGRLIGIVLTRDLDSRGNPVGYGGTIESLWRHRHAFSVGVLTPDAPSAETVIHPRVAQ
jgi:S1-C subfamily serine protease